MRITVKKDFLNVMVGKPSMNAPTYQHLAPGSEIEVDGKLYNGDTYAGINTWYKDAGNNYYWSGGVSEQSSKTTNLETTNIEAEAISKVAQYPPSKINLNSNLLNLPINIRNSQGKGITIAVLDRGVEKKHPDLSTVLESVDFTNNVKDGALDVNGHGTFMCSLIGAKAYLPDKGVTGIASSSQILSAKVIYDKNNPLTNDSVANGLKYAKQKKADIINLSIGINQTANVVAELDSLGNVIAVAATKQFSEVNKASDLLQFPANHPLVIPVAAVSKDFYEKNQAQLPAPLVIIPYQNVWGCSIKFNDYYEEDAGSSVSTAFIAGAIALILSNNPTLSRTKEAILAELNRYSDTPDQLFNNTGKISWTIKM